MARDRAVESWLRHEISEAWDALKADPERALSPEHVRQHLAQLHARQS